jgi:hypothetical protein
MASNTSANGHQIWDHSKSLYAKTYNSFSGADIIATITPPKGAPIVIGELQTISYSTFRPTMPVYGLGQVGAKGVVRGVRNIAGTLIFTVFDRHALYRVKEEMMLYDGEDPTTLIHDNMKADEIPPFDITITFLNEQGQSAQLALYGVFLISEGQTMSIEDMITENTMEFIAMDMDVMKQDSEIWSTIGNKPGKNVSGSTANRSAPNPVTNLTIASTTSNSATITWKASSSQNVVNYHIYKGNTRIDTVTHLAGAQNVNNTYTYTIKNLDGSSPYTIAVYAKDNNGNLSEAAWVSTKTKPNNVENLKASSITATSVSLTWSVSTLSEDISYEILNGTTLLDTVSGNSVTISGLTKDTNYNLTIRTKDNRTHSTSIGTIIAFRTTP